MKEPLSITHPSIAAYWHPMKNGNFTPDMFLAGSGKKAWWKCPIAEDHEWETEIRKIVRTKKKVKTCACAFCSGQKVALSNCLATTHSKIAKQWHPTKNGDLTPYAITGGSTKKIWWICNKFHEWKAMPKTRTNKNIESGCPVCNESKGEKRIANFLINNNIVFERDKRFNSCKDKLPLSFDFWVESVGLIEYQGEQHYKPTSYGCDPEEKLIFTQRHDAIKRNWCENNGISLLEISYLDYDKIEELLKSIFNYGLL